MKLTKGSIKGHVRRQSAFMVVALFPSLALAAAESYFAAQLGATSLAAFGFAAPVAGLFMAIGISLCTGMSAITAPLIGKQDHATCQAVAVDGLILMELCLIAIASIVGVSVGGALNSIGASHAVASAAKNYLVAWLLFVPFLGVLLVATSLLRALGEARAQAVLMTITAVINLLLSPVLMFGVFGAPKMGLPGAAVAAGVSFVVGAAAAISRLWASAFLRGMDWTRTNGRFTKSCRAILHVGLPSMLSKALEIVGVLIFLAIVANEGTIAVGAYAAAGRIEGLILIYVVAVSMAIATIVGQNLGAGNFDRIEAATRYGTRVVLTIGALLALGSWLFGPRVAAVFTRDAELQTALVLYFQIAPICYGAVAVTAIVKSAFAAMKRPTPMFVLGAGACLLVVVPLAFVGQRVNGLQGIIIGSTFANVIIGIAAMLWLQKEIRRDRSLQEAARAVAPG